MSGSRVPPPEHLGCRERSTVDPHGWPVLVAGTVTANRDAQIDAIQKAMFNEGPGKGEAHGHYENMMNAKFRRVGVGPVDVSGKLCLTNDFSQ